MIEDVHPAIPSVRPAFPQTASGRLGTALPRFCAECGHKFDLPAGQSPKFCAMCGEKVRLPEPRPVRPSASDPRPVRPSASDPRLVASDPGPKWETDPVSHPSPGGEPKPPLGVSAEDSKPSAGYSGLDALLQATAEAKATVIFEPGSGDHSDQTINVTIMSGSPTLMGIPRTDLYARTLMGAARSDLYQPPSAGLSHAAPFPPAPVFPVSPMLNPGYWELRERRSRLMGSLFALCLLITGIALVVAFILLQGSL